MIARDKSHPAHIGCQGVDVLYALGGLAAVFPTSQIEKLKSSAAVSPNSGSLTSGPGPNSPFCFRYSQRCDPMKPPAPVTNTRICSAINFKQDLRSYYSSPLV